MSKIIIATANKGKAKEFEKTFAKFNIEVATLADFPEIGEIEETGTTFAENAALKAETVASVLNQTVIADDSGLIVDALDGAPGVYSARYAGVAHDDAKNNEKLLKNLEGVEPDNRTARFHCTLAVATPSEKTSFYTGEVEGVIAEQLCGTNGFGYDPLFFLPEFGLTMAEIPAEKKNEISHRANAIKQLEKDLAEVVEKVTKK